MSYLRNIWFVALALSMAITYQNCGQGFEADMGSNSDIINIHEIEFNTAIKYPGDNNGNRGRLIEVDVRKAKVVETAPYTCSQINPNDSTCYGSSELEVKYTFDLDVSLYNEINGTRKCLNVGFEHAPLFVAPNNNTAVNHHDSGNCLNLANRCNLANSGRMLCSITRRSANGLYDQWNNNVNTGDVIRGMMFANGVDSQKANPRFKLYAHNSGNMTDNIDSLNLNSPIPVSVTYRDGDGGGGGGGGGGDATDNVKPFGHLKSSLDNRFRMKGCGTDNDKASTKLRVQLFKGSVSNANKIGEVTADRSYSGTGCAGGHGFRFRVPESLRSGTKSFYAKVLSVKTDGSDGVNSKDKVFGPITVNFGGGGGGGGGGDNPNDLNSPKGNVKEVAGTTRKIRGCAKDTDKGAAAVTVQLFVNGQFVTEKLANSSNEAGSAGCSGGDHGFTFQVGTNGSATVKILNIDNSGNRSTSMPDKTVGPIMIPHPQ